MMMSMRTLEATMSQIVLHIFAYPRHRCRCRVENISARWLCRKICSISPYLLCRPPDFVLHDNSNISHRRRIVQLRILKILISFLVFIRSRWAKQQNNGHLPIFPLRDNCLIRCTSSTRSAFVPITSIGICNDLNWCFSLPFNCYSNTKIQNKRHQNQPIIQFTLFMLSAYTQHALTCVEPRNTSGSKSLSQPFERLTSLPSLFSISYNHRCKFSWLLLLVRSWTRMMPCVGL